MSRHTDDVSAADCADVDRFTRLSAVLTTEMLTVALSTPPRAVFELLDAAHARLWVGHQPPGDRGVLVEDDAQRRACEAADGGLRASAGEREGAAEEALHAQVGRHDG